MSVCAAAVRQVEWRPLVPLLVFAGFFHAVVAAILLSAGLPIGYLPTGQFYIGGIFSFGIVAGSRYVLGPQLALDMLRQRRGLEVTPFHERVAGAVRLVVPGLVLALIFPIVMLANANLKPALFVLNPSNYDAGLESLERALFGGVLPTEWLVAHSSTTALHVWDFIYGLFGVFLFVSMVIALYHQGMRGGARLVLALSLGLFITLMLSLLYPTRGPIFEHPEWFGRLEGTHTWELAGFLTQTVREYATEPAVRYAHAGISAMPSYHVLSWVCAVFCWRVLPRPFLVFGCVLVMLNWISTVVLGWHYALDGLAGMALAVVVWWLAGLLISRAKAPHPRSAISTQG